MGTENIMKPRFSFAMEVSGLPYQRIHEVSDTQKYGIGARYHESGSGRVYRYARSHGICFASRGAAMWATITQGVTYGLLSGTQQIGDRQATMAAAAHDSFEKDELQGGLFSIALATNKRQDLFLSGNDEAADGAAVTVYFDEPLTTATDGTINAYISPNPYYALYGTDGEDSFFHTFAGVPAAYISAAGKFFWCQTWGPCYIDGTGDWHDRATYRTQAVWHLNGCVCTGEFAQVDEHTYIQDAGFCTVRAGRRTIMLQISP